jgi:hypothetical protein
MTSFFPWAMCRKRPSSRKAKPKILMATLGFHGTQQLAKSGLAFAAHNKVNETAGILSVSLGRTLGRSDRTVKLVRD